MESILVVDDEKNYLLVLSAVLEDEGYEVLTAQGGQEALEIQKSSDLDLILTDMKMPAMNGLELLEKIKAMDQDLPVIVMTAHGTVDKAVEAMQKGAYSYILKPFDNERLILYVKKAVAMYQVVKENRRLRDAVKSQYRFGNFIGKSKPVRDVFEMIRKVAPSNVTVLVEGESGTGKGRVARVLLGGRISGVPVDKLDAAREARGAVRGGRRRRGPKGVEPGRGERDGRRVLVLVAVGPRAE